MNRSWLWLLAPALVACDEGGHAEYAALAMSISRGTDYVTHCVPLPVEPGGSIVDDLPVTAGMTVHVVSIPDSIDVTLGGSLVPVRRFLTHDQVYAGYDEWIPAEAPDGESVMFVLQSPCE